MTEKAHSSWYMPAISLFFRASVVFPPLTSLIDAIETGGEQKVNNKKPQETKNVLMML